MDGGERHLSDVGGAVEAEDAAALVESDHLLNAAHGRVHVLHVVQVAEYERLLLLEPAGDDVLRVLISEAVALIEVDLLEEELLVVRQLDDERHLEHTLWGGARGPEGKAEWK